MGTLQATLKRYFGFDSEPKINFQPPFEDIQTIADTTDALNTMSVPESEVRVYQSIQPLKGKYANVSFMDNFLANIEEYNREINEINEE